MLLTDMGTTGEGQDLGQEMDLHAYVILKISKLRETQELKLASVHDNSL